MTKSRETDNRQAMERALTASATPVALALSGYRPEEEFIQHLHLAADLLCLRLNRSDLQDAFFAAARVMLLNGLRANIKEVIFRENDWRSGDPDDYRLGLDAFRMALGTGGRNLFGSYGPLFKEFELPVELLLCQHSNALLIQAVNHFGLDPNDEITILKKLERSRSIYELFQFFEEGDRDPTCHEAIFRASTALETARIEPRLFLTPRSPGRTGAALLLPLPDAASEDLRALVEVLETGRSPIPDPVFEKNFEN